MRTASIMRDPPGVATWPRIAGSGGDRGRYEMGSTAATLAAFEVAVAGRRAALARSELVGIHGEAHRAAGLAPVEAGLDEDLVEAFRIGLLLDESGARHDERAHAVCDLVALGDGGRRPKVFDAAVGAAADEDRVDGDVAHRRARCETHVFECSGAGIGLAGIVVVAGVGTVLSIGATWPGLVPHVMCGRTSRRR